MSNLNVYCYLHEWAAIAVVSEVTNIISLLLKTIILHLEYDAFIIYSFIS